MLTGRAVDTVKVLEQDVVLQSIDRAIEAIHNAAMKNGGKYNLEQRDVLQKLIHHRKETVSRKSHSPSTQGMTPSSSDHHLDLARQPNGFCRTGYERHHSLPNTETKEEEGSLYQTFVVPKQLFAVIDEVLKKKTGESPKNSYKGKKCLQDSVAKETQANFESENGTA
ncbi:UNVERIFIED_CONTAM: hypothetical protein K2H54_050381 [Gekko kuhli]